MEIDCVENRHYHKFVQCFLSHFRWPAAGSSSSSPPRHSTLTQHTSVGQITDRTAVQFFSAGTERLSMRSRKLVGTMIRTAKASGIFGCALIRRHETSAEWSHIAGTAGVEAQSVAVAMVRREAHIPINRSSVHTKLQRARQPPVVGQHARVRRHASAAIASFATVATVAVDLGAMKSSLQSTHARRKTTSNQRPLHHGKRGRLLQAQGARVRPCMGEGAPALHLERGRRRDEMLGGACASWCRSRERERHTRGRTRQMNSGTREFGTFQS